jgi:diadenosine tetraphosphate (Ap4A) HIT family hydrolase
MEDCSYCSATIPPAEQLYETKLFRVVVARRSLCPGHVIILRKSHDPHLYSFTPDDIDELEYLEKKVSFWVMRLTHASGFTLLMHDGTPEVGNRDHLEVHIIPRLPGDALSGVMQGMHDQKKELDNTAVQHTVAELQQLMQLPQPPM